jgi:hypothetical protein
MEPSFFGTWLQRRAVALSMPIVNPAETRVICLGAIRPSAPVVGVLMEDRIETFPHAVFRAAARSEFLQRSFSTSPSDAEGSK